MYDERFMREALTLASEAASEGEVPVGAVVGRGKMRSPMRSSWLSTMPAVDSAGGGSGNVTSTSHWSRARCVQER